VLGARQFTGQVPLRSRVGNTVARLAFRAASGRDVRDTQTGLRGYPHGMLTWLCSVPGDRFEYEMNVLLQAARSGRPVEQAPIETIYLDHNSSSHFRPLVDSVRVFAPLVRFSASSLLAFAIDVVALIALHRLTGMLLLSAIGARLVSSAVNFGVNRRLVFRAVGAGRVGAQALRYWSLVGSLFAANFAVLAALTAGGLNLLPAKLLTELSLFAVSYCVQRWLIFRRDGEGLARKPSRPRCPVRVLPAGSAQPLASAAGSRSAVDGPLKGP
jgi:putative flippase GtrA